MKKTTLLIDNSLTGGRGMAKQGFEVIQACKERGIDYLVCTDEGFVYKLRDMGVEPDILVPTALNDRAENANTAFEKALQDVDFQYLVKIGARMPGPRVAYKRKIPYSLIDAALPDIMEEDTGNTFYPRDVFLAAEKYFLTTQFDWEFPNRMPDLKTVVTTTYPLSQRTKKILEELRATSDAEITQRVAAFVPEAKTASYDATIALIITGSYVSEIADRVTYGGWLTARQYDQVIGFVRRCITDLGEMSKKKLLVYMDAALLDSIRDLQQKYKNTLTLCTSTSTKWSYQEEFLIQRWAQVLVSRAANYQPFMAYMRRGGIVTTPVPSDGYMDEDDAAEQSAGKSLTQLIQYDDEQYAQKLLVFVDDTKQQQYIASAIDAMQLNMFKSRDCIELLLQQFVSEA